MSKKVVFMGTPEFAVESLRALHKAGIEIAAVVTVPDKPAGRGQQVSESPVKKYALEQGFKILQPEKLKAEDFLKELEMIQADLFVVVAFRMLPEQVWAMPQLGTINLHGSLLPQYRGAAPINWAVINGETETGATTFFIEREIDTGNIIDQVKIPINPEDTAGTVHDRLMTAGSSLLVKTVNQIFEGTAKSMPQSSFIKDTLKEAPKIFKEDGRLNWGLTTTIVLNKIRGLSPYPCAWTELSKDGQVKSLKIYQAALAEGLKLAPGELGLKESKLYVGCSDGSIELKEVQLEGKKRMSVGDFLNGFQPAGWSIIY